MVMASRGPVSLDPNAAMVRLVDYSQSLGQEEYKGKEYDCRPPNLTIIFSSNSQDMKYTGHVNILYIFTLPCPSSGRRRGELSAGWGWGSMLL